MRAALEISFGRTVTTSNTFQWHRMGCKTCLLVWHIKPAQLTQSVTSEEKQDYSSQQKRWLCSKSNLNYGSMSEHWGFLHISNISRDFERDWVRVFFLPASAWLPMLAFKSQSIHYFPNTKDLWTGKEQIQDPFVNKPGESTLSLPEEHQLLDAANDGSL